MSRIAWNKFDPEQFYTRANDVHKSAYTYSNDYVDRHTPINITCPIHGPFKQKPSDHLDGCGCQKCFGNKVITTESFITDSKKKYGERFDYAKTKYLDNRAKVEIRCIEHDTFFWQVPYTHLKGYNGCKQCGAKVRHKARAENTEIFVEKANKIQGQGTYDYGLTIYVSSIEPVEIFCKTHGSFWQTPNAHIQGAGCPKCSHIVSKAEQRWLVLLGLPNQTYRYIKIGGKNFKPDAIIEEEKKIFEFDGDFWHGNPDKFDPEDTNFANFKTYGELHEKTLKKKDFLRFHGYTVISIWENDFYRIERYLAAHPEDKIEIGKMLREQNGRDVISHFHIP